MQHSFFQWIRRAVLAGMLVVVPAAASIWVMKLLVDLLKSGIYLVPSVIRPETPALETLLGVSLAITLILLIGIGTQNYLGARAVRFSEAVLARVPILSSIYLGVKQLMEALFSTQQGYFEQAVLVQWPRPGAYVIGFHTGDAGTFGGKDMINVFMPTTPNPTTGFYFMVPKDEVIFTELSVEEAFKLIVSAGIVKPPNGFALSSYNNVIPDAFTVSESKTEA